MAPHGIILPHWLVMAGFVPVSDEMIERSRSDRRLRRRLLSRHLDLLMIAMGQARKRANADPETIRQLQEGARLAVQLTELLHNGGGETARKGTHEKN